MPTYPESSCAACAAPVPITTPWPCPPFFCASCCAAVSADSVAFFRCPWACSPISRIVAISDHLRVFVKLLHQRRHVRHLHARGPRGRRFHPDDLDLGTHVDAQPGGGELLDRLLLGLHDVGQARGTGAGQAEV